MDKITAIDAARQYAQLVAQELKPATILLFGSYAKNTVNSDSDIDVAVVFNGFDGDWLDTSARLWRLRRDISDNIEPILLDSSNDASGFIENIFKTGEILYSTQ